MPLKRKEAITMNEDIKKYTTPSGRIRYKFSIYVGKDATNGQSIQVRKKGLKSLEDAEKLYKDIQERIKNGEYSGYAESHYKISKFYELWLANYKRTVKESTWTNIDQYFNNHILKDLGNIYLDKLTPMQCQKVVNHWFTSCGYPTFKALCIYSKKMLDYAVQIDAIRKNPMRKIYEPKQKSIEHDFTDFYSKNELIHFLNVCKKNKPLKVYTMFHLLAYTGLRIGEALALKWSDIDLDNGTLKVSKTLSKGKKNSLVVNPPKTNNGYRSIELTSQTIEVLREWKFQQRRDLFRLGLNPMNKDQIVFNNKNNDYLRINVVNYWNVSLCNKYGLRHIKLHGFRHTHASLLFEAGASMEDVKERMGHSSITTTMNIYTHVTKSQKRETADIFGNFMQNLG